MEPQRCGIYKITNQLNGKIYIGQSVNIPERWGQHRRKYKDKYYQTSLYIAMRQDGLENFTFEVIEYCERKDLNQREQYYIEYYQTLNPDYGYNMSRIDNYIGKMSYDQVREIQALLIKDQNFTISNREIALQYDVSYTWVSLVNKGEIWHNNSFVYPLRKIQYNVKQNFYYCVDCGKEISRYSTRCDACNKIYRASQSLTIISREELKELIRTKSFTDIGKMYNVSDNAIRKWCDRYNLPRRKKDIKAYSDEEWKSI